GAGGSGPPSWPHLTRARDLRPGDRGRPAAGGVAALPRGRPPPGGHGPLGRRGRRGSGGHRQRARLARRRDPPRGRAHGGGDAVGAHATPRPAAGVVPAGSRRMRRLLLVAAAAAVLLLPALPAAAHASLVETEPPDGASLGSAPDRVTLTF